MVGEIKYSLWDYKNAIKNIVGDPSGLLRIDENYTQAVNDAILSAQSFWRDTIWLTSTTTFDSGTLAYTIPNAAGIDMVHNVYLVDEDNQRHIASHWVVQDSQIIFTKPLSHLTGRSILIEAGRIPRRLLDLTQGANDGYVVANVAQFNVDGFNFLVEGVTQGDVLSYQLTDSSVWSDVFITGAYNGYVTTISAPWTSTWYNMNWAVAKWSTVPIAYVRHAGAAYIYTMMGQVGAATDVQELLNWAAYHQQRADAIAREYRKRPNIRYRRG